MTGLQLRIDRALQFIAGEQQKDGGFLSYSSPDPHYFDHAIEYRTNFCTALILSALQHATDSCALKVREAAAQYLLRQKHPHWSWNYWALGSTQAFNRPTPDDLDDTSCALIALLLHNPALLDNQAGEAVARLLRANQIHGGGLYRTWIVPEGEKTNLKDVDLAVNANVAYLLSLQNKEAVEIYRLIEHAIRTCRIGSPYYPVAHPIMYFIARSYRRHRGLMLQWWQEQRRDRSAWNNVLRASLSVSSQLRLGGTMRSVQDDVEFILASQLPNGNWPAAAFCIDPVLDGRVHYAGASALTTALCIEALTLYTSQVRQEPELGNQIDRSIVKRNWRVPAGGFGQRAGLSWRSIADSIEIALKYLDRHLSPSGRFDYIYDGASNQPAAGYNLVRHAGTSMILNRIAGTPFDDGTVTRAADRSLFYLTQFLGETESEGRRRCCVIENFVAKLGATALMLLALTYKVQRSAVPDPRDLRLLNRLAHHLTSQQAPDGRFICKYDFSTGLEIPSSSMYFPGEAILALCAAFRVTRDPDFLSHAARGARYLLQQEPLVTAADLRPVDHWLVMSLEVLHSFDNDSEWVKHLRRLANPMLLETNESRPPSWLAIGSTCEIATRVEGLIAAATVERRVGESKRTLVLLQKIFSGIARCYERQVGERRCSRLHPDAEGGFLHSSLSQNLIRIDYVQHVTAASFGVLESLGSRACRKPERSRG